MFLSLQRRLYIILFIAALISMLASHRVFISAVVVDMVCGIVFPARVFMVSPICGVGLGIEQLFTVPAALAGVLAETAPAPINIIAKRTRDTLIFIVVYKIACGYF